MGFDQKVSVIRGSVDNRGEGAASAKLSVISGIIGVLLIVACGGGTSAAPSSATTLTPASPSLANQVVPIATPKTTPTQELLRESRSGAITIIEIAEGSAARYSVNEQLARRDLPSDAVGKTSVIEGTFSFDSEGNVVTERSKVVIDLRSLSSGQDRRDNFLRERSLESNLYPTATFVLRETDGLIWPLPGSGEHSFRMIGDLNIRDVTREVVWDATLRVDGDSVSGHAKTEFTFDYFEINKPSLVFLLSVADEISLELDLVAEIRLEN